MAGFLSTTELASINSDFDTVFLTMSNGRFVTVVKEPIKTLVSTPSTNNLYGFGEKQADPTYVFTPNFKTFPCILSYGQKINLPLNPEINVRIYAGPATLKVKKDCYDYIMQGGVKHLGVENEDFYIDGEIRRQMFFSTEYYIVALKATK